MKTSKILVINSGSSSLKFCLYHAGDLNIVVEGLAERLHTDSAVISWHGCVEGREPLLQHDHAGALGGILRLIDGVGGTQSIRAIGHRVVHGGEYFTASTIIDGDVIDKIRTCSRLAPLHNPANLLGIETLAELLPDVPQVAVFDTAFHQTLPEKAYLYALPLALYRDHGVRRYGFHGTSHCYVAAQAALRIKNACRFVTLHLGNGCSASAIRDGVSVDTSMGLTPLEGLVMGTRCGDIDPGIFSFLSQSLELSIEQINELLNKKSGLLGLSGLTNDMRELMAAAQAGNTQAVVAVEVFCYRLAKTVGSLAVAAGGLQALVFTGGIGEHSSAIREKVVEQLAMFSLKVDPLKNDTHGKSSEGLISTDGTPAILVIPTQEELAIAEDTNRLVSKS